MKRILTFFAAISVVMVAMAQAGGITVSTYNKDTKETKLQFFRTDQLGSAIEAAEPNDTIYLSAGDYNYNSLPTKTYPTSSSGNTVKYSVIQKPLVFIGVGGYENTNNNSRLDGTNHIAIDLSEYEGDIKNVSFEGVYFNAYMVIASDVDNITFRNFQSKSIQFVSDPENTSKVSDLLVDRCYIPNIYLGNERIGRANILNTRISDSLTGRCYENKAAAFLNHCYIYTIENSFIGLAKNSLIYSDKSKSDAVLEYCGYYSSSESAKNNCYKISSSVSDLNLTPSKLSEECVSDDETPLGTSGGTTPYTLEPSYPTPNGSKSSALLVTGEDGTKKLKVSVAILGEKTAE